MYEWLTWYLKERSLDWSHILYVGVYYKEYNYCEVFIAGKVFYGQLQSSCKSLASMMYQEGILGLIWYLVYVYHIENKNVMIYVKLKVIWGEQWLDCENLVNTISQDGSFNRSHI